MANLSPVETLERLDEVHQLLEVARSRELRKASYSAERDELLRKVIAAVEARRHLEIARAIDNGNQAVLAKLSAFERESIGLELAKRSAARDRARLDAKPLRKISMTGDLRNAQHRSPKGQAR